MGHTGHISPSYGGHLWVIWDIYRLVMVDTCAKSHENQWMWMEVMIWKRIESTIYNAPQTY